MLPTIALLTVLAASNGPLGLPGPLEISGHGEECSVSPEGSPSQMVYSISGSRVSLKAHEIQLQAGPQAGAAMIVYSEPSHTPLILAITKEFSQTAQGLGLLEEGTGAQVLLVEALPGTDVTLLVDGRPGDDERIAISVVFEPGQSPVLVADAAVADQQFGFRSYEAAAGPEKGGSFQHCCSGGTCENQCTNCSGPRFTCCLLGGSCCWIECGWTVICSVGCGTSNCLC